jgi:alpha/beta superfamily hydrolase
MNQIKIMMTPFLVMSTSEIQLSAKLWSSSTASISPVVLFVHQYAKMGGCGQLMEGMAKRIASAGYTAVTFDLRGAGKSTGSCSYTNFIELNDVKAVVDHIVREMNRDVVIVGSSGGAALAGAALDYSDRIQAGLFIGYTWGWWASFLFGWAFEAIESSPKPKLFVVGDNDQFTSMALYEQKIPGLKGPVNEMKLIPGKDHFEIEQVTYDKKITEWLIEFMASISADAEGKTEECADEK